MNTVRSGTARVAGLILALSLAAPTLQAQTTTMPSTLRYGSGLMDIPVASVLPHLAITGTYSGFFMTLDNPVQIDASGNPIGYGTQVDKFYQDASVALGLGDRVEVGTTIQSLNDGTAGGNIWGLFGRLQLVQPTNQGLGLAVGARYVRAPDFGDGTSYQPNRLGIPDNRFRKSYVGLADDINTEFSIYGVTTAYIRGFDGGALPEHDLSFSLGYGTGMFQDGDALNFYNFADSEGWFFGSGIHFKAGENGVLTFMGEYNGFDVNVGAQLDVNGIRVGAQYLALNYSEPAGGYWSEYRKPKFGLLASVAVCPLSDGFLCKAETMERPEPMMVQMPAPPPDTVLITREVERMLPDGTPAMVCLATGENIEVRVTAQGDTLVGPERASIESLRPGVVFAGTYAQGAGWYTNDGAITFENRSYSKSGNEVRLGCDDIMRVGEHMGVPLFANRMMNRPFEMLYVPVRPGVWQGYQAGLRRTRG